MSRSQSPWNRGKLVGQKLPLKRKEIWAIRVRLELAGNIRQVAMFDLAIDSKLRACDLVQLRLRDISHGSQIAARARVIQRKTSQPVQFEITPQTRGALKTWIEEIRLRPDDYLFPGKGSSRHLSTRQYARIVKGWVESIGLDGFDYGTHSMRRTKASLIYQRTKNLRAIQLLLGHSKIESTVRYLGVEVDDALMMAEQTDI
ncbi:tyrosine-type recombinase/integrase [Pseudoxanthomonas winnipegensis]|uniref:tyrosine-type recombinase/integrase n=1 Tax=Pseudoxanthomonas winnipegensis TaxID=2480810 RepID=UPI00103DB2AC|nr:tyrosine-type recombinase/integrase [Pseudoxanthomonas winnipegensis]TBV75851.1 integrase [Pseudoxanthomonas winnipegensis]